MIAHIDRYGLSTPAAIAMAGVKGAGDEATAHHRLNALCKRGDLRRAVLDGVTPAYILSPSARSRLGRVSPRDEDRGLSLPLKLNLYGMLLFCCAQHVSRHKLTPTELRQRFSDLHRPGREHRYYVTRDGPVTRLGFLRIDSGGRGRWDRIVGKFADDLRGHLQIPLVRRLLENNAFEATIVSALPTKAGRIESELSQYQKVLPIPCHSVAIPQLANVLISRPA